MFFYLVIVFSNIFLQLINGELTFQNGSYCPLNTLSQ